MLSHTKGRWSSGIAILSLLTSAKNCVTAGCVTEYFANLISSLAQEET